MGFIKKYQRMSDCRLNEIVNILSKQGNCYKIFTCLIFSDVIQVLLRLPTDFDQREISDISVHWFRNSIEKIAHFIRLQLFCNTMFNSFSLAITVSGNAQGKWDVFLNTLQLTFQLKESSLWSWMRLITRCRHEMRFWSSLYNKCLAMTLLTYGNRIRYGT